MNIIVWGINYAPETTGIAPHNLNLCRYLEAKGHDTGMVTTFAYYPAWEKSPEDRGRLYRREILDGIPIHRCWHYVPKNVTVLKRILHEASFVASSFLRLLFLPTPDVYIVVSPPLLLGVAAWILTRLKQNRAPFIFHVQDLQPDAAVGLGMIQKNLFTRLLYRLEAIAYDKAILVSGVTRAMTEAFEQKGVPREKIILFPNTISIPDSTARPQAGNFRRREGFAPDDFLVVYSGNLGVKQGLDILVESARHLTDPKIKIILCGDGVQKQKLETKIRRENLNNVRLLPLQPDGAYQEALVDTDLAIITQISGTGKFFLPSKILNTAAHALPVLTVADEESELVRFIQDARCGVNILPGEPRDLARAIEHLQTNRNKLREQGERGLSYIRNFETHHVLSQFETTLRHTLEISRTSLPSL